MNKPLYFIYYSLFSVGLFFLITGIWVLFSSLNMIPIIIISAAAVIFSFLKMKKIAEMEQIIKDIFPLFVWIIAIVAANIYVEFAYGASGLEAVKYMTSWQVILLFIVVIVINKLFSLFYGGGEK